jgi:hypothetical protein
MDVLATYRGHVRILAVRVPLDPAAKHAFAEDAAAKVLRKVQAVNAIAVAVGDTFGAVGSGADAVDTRAGGTAAEHPVRQDVAPFAEVFTEDAGSDVCGAVYPGATDGVAGGAGAEW